jgi:hypothetical protein
MNRDNESSAGAQRVEVVGGVARHLDHLVRDDRVNLEQLEGKRLLRMGQVEDGNVGAQQLEQERMNLVEMAVDRTPGEVEESRSSLEVDCQ